MQILTYGTDEHGTDLMYMSAQRIYIVTQDETDYNGERFPVVAFCSMLEAENYRTNALAEFTKTRSESHPDWIPRFTIQDTLLYSNLQPKLTYR